MALCQASVMVMIDHDMGPSRAPFRAIAFVATPAITAFAAPIAPIMGMNLSELPIG